MNNSIFGISIALVSTLSWALCTVALKKLGERLDPIGMTTIKAILASILLCLIIFFTGETFNISTNKILTIAISGILGIAIGDSLFFASLNRLSPLILSIILFVGPDLFSGIFGFIFLKEMPTLQSWIGIFCILFGLAFLIFPIQKENLESKTKITGIIFALLSLICTAYSMVIIKPVLNDIPIITATMYRMLFSSIILLLFGLFTKKLFSWKQNLNNKKYNIQLAGTLSLATIGGFWLSLVAIKHCKLIIASSLMSLEPLFILIFTILFFKHMPKRNEIIGLLTIIIGIIFICFG